MIIEYEKAIKLLDKKLNHLSMFRTWTWIEINDQSKKSIIPIVTLDLKL